MENPRITTDNQHLEKKRKTQEHCLMESSKEQEILETAAFHLILLSQPSSSNSRPNHHQSDHHGDGDHDHDHDHGGFRMMMKKKKQDDAILVEGINATQISDKDANSICTTFSSSSSSSSSAETTKSGISVLEDDQEVQHQHEVPTTPRQPKPRFRSLVDIYSVTRPL
ncbi:uncharacterized protein LOC112516260 [Cynara cardunculus var. scolymus]|uniref:uncharacterized protein LOC112516260 n=1 Tax=Cynara cardunculus var. scolymus TaxID=59895 RepID=UPI000D6253BA|nr:uncharacterized protein LOC112516260 [Cynara cardunculus var. scolymus]